MSRENLLRLSGADERQNVLISDVKMASSEYVAGLPRLPVEVTCHLSIASSENQTVMLPLCTRDLLYSFQLRMRYFVFDAILILLVFVNKIEFEDFQGKFAFETFHKDMMQQTKKHI